MKVPCDIPVTGEINDLLCRRKEEKSPSLPSRQVMISESRSSVVSGVTPATSAGKSVRHTPSQVTPATSAPPQTKGWKARLSSTNGHLQPLTGQSWKHAGRGRSSWAVCVSQLLQAERALAKLQSARQTRKTTEGKVGGKGGNTRRCHLSTSLVSHASQLHHLHLPPELQDKRRSNQCNQLSTQQPEPMLSSPPTNR